VDRAIQERLFSYANRQEGMNYYISFLFWPFGVTLGALRHWDRPWAKNVFWLFCIFLGLTFIIAQEGGADSDRYARLFLRYAHSKMNLEELWSSFYSESTGYVDIASPLITFLVSRLTANPVILFTVFGAIFGYFYSRNIWFVIEKMEGKVTLLVLVYIFSFALLNPIWNINGFRMWTAAQIFLYGTLPYLLDGNKKKLVWALISVFFHFSFMFPIGMLGIYYVLKNRTNIYLVFFIATAFIREINLLDVRSALSFLPGVFYSRVIAYTNPDYAESVGLAREALNWYMIYSNQAVKWVIYAMVIYIYLFGRKVLKERKDLTSLLCYSLLLYGAANIFSLVPSGGRYIVVASTFMLAFIIIFITSFREVKGIIFIQVLSLPFLALFCTVAIRMGMDYYGLMTFIGNPIIAAFYTDTVPVIESLKKLL